MGNYRFKLSELVPNAWFYKLRDMGKSRRKHQTQQNVTLSPSLISKHQSTTTTAHSPKLPPRRSSRYSRPDKTAPSDTPRKSTKNRLRHRPNPQIDFSTGTGSFSPEFRSDKVLIPDDSLEIPWRSPCSCVSSNFSKAPPPELDLRPIITKPANRLTTVRKTTVSSPAGVKLRLRSPRISARKSGVRKSGPTAAAAAAAASSRRSRAVVKASVDPRKDFKESMEEMIVENNIRASKDLEELLACYLCLNSNEYHHIIINVFKQIWLDLNLPLQNS